ncbi:TPR repeat-containing protein DDB_G0287407-like [Lineus longissimus]|uniref:TPR repeat-containing protein DDB_G0287407-like n=1 Tax=Lineus longissimus TaxID=88925 RepID=UPI002B4CE18D
MGCIESKVDSEASATKGRNASTDDYDAFNSRENVRGYGKDRPKAQRRTTLEEVVTNAHKRSLRDKKDIERLKKFKLKLDSWRTVDIEKVREQLGPNMEWWAVGPKLCIHKPVPLIPESKRKGWRTVRIFVSSTFVDFQFEREFLVKKIFPHLRAWCEERKIRLIDVDLRWGVPKDSTAKETLVTCLAEIDRCCAENKHPYFLGMISERFGWVPSEDQVPDELAREYKWIPGMSVTAWEMMTGAYWDRNPNALISLRNPNFLDQIRDRTIREAYQESTEKGVLSLKKLKGLFRDTFPNQTFDYNCKVVFQEGARVELGEFDAFGDRVLNFFKQNISKQYPPDHIFDKQSSLDNYYQDQSIFMAQWSRVVGRETIAKQVHQYVDEDQTPLTPLIILGKPGAGKSAMMAHMVKEMSENSKYKVFFHFIGATPGSADTYTMLSRLWHEFLPSEPLPSEQEDLQQTVGAMLERAAAKEKKKKWVVFFDALNQLETEDARRLRWLPKTFSSNIRIIVSTTDASSCLNVLRQRDPGLPEILLKPLDEAVRRELVTNYFANYNKKLDKNQLTAIVSKQEAGRPLYLAIALEDLRVFGSFKWLDKKIADLPGDLKGLLEMVLDRIVMENGRELVTATVCLLEVSRYGLSESELLELLSMNPVTPSSTMKNSMWYQRLPMADWSPIYISLRMLLRPSGTSTEGRLQFFHKCVRDVVCSQYIKSEQHRKWWHKRLADFFQNCPDVSRKSEELPYHLEQTGDIKRLQTCLLDKDIFDHLYREETRHELMRYWRSAGGYDLAATQYMVAFEALLKDNSVDDIETTAAVEMKLAWFLIDIAQYDTARSLLLGILEQLERTHGVEAHHLMEPLHALVMLFYKRSLNYVYATDDGFKKCKEQGELVAERCVKVYTKHRASDDVHLGEVLTLCGYFLGQKCLEAAQALFEKCRNRSGLVEVYYLLGEKNQYHQDLSVPVKYFEKSLEYATIQFGIYHQKLARCYQLFAQLYWNTYVTFEPLEDYLLKALDLYKKELAIQEELLGSLHPTTVRAREDVIIVLETLNRNDEALKYKHNQPIT